MAFTNYLLFSKLMGVKNAPGILEVARTTRTVIECFNLDEYVEPARPLNRYAEPQRSGNTFKNKNNNNLASTLYARCNDNKTKPGIPGQSITHYRHILLGKKVALLKAES